MQGNKYSDLIQSNFEENLSLRNIKDGWKEIKKGNDIHLYTTKYKNMELKLAKTEGVAPVNIEKVYNYYSNDFEGQKKCRDMCEQLTIVEEVDDDTVVTLFKTKSKFVVSSREVLGVQHRRKLNENEYIIIRDHLEDHPNVPKSKDVVRGEGKFFVIVLTKVDENTTKFEMYVLFDPKGSVPTSVANALIEEQHGAVLKDVEFMKKL